MRETDYHPHLHGRDDDIDEFHGRGMDSWRQRTTAMDTLRPRAEAYSKNGNLRLDPPAEQKER